MISVTSFLRVNPFLRTLRLLRREAVEQTVAVRRAQGALTAATREVRRVPGRSPLAAAAAIVMAEHCAAGIVARPPGARGIVRAGHQRAVRVAAGEDVVPLRRDPCPLLAQRRVAIERAVVAVQVGDARGDLHAERVDPRALADSIAGVDRGTR